MFKKLIFINNLVFSYVLKILLLVVLSSTGYADTCSKESYASLVSIKRVVDADTVELSTGERVRLIGIDAPELGRQGRADEPFSREGKRALEQQLAAYNNRVWIQLGEDPKDRHGRLLADLFFEDGRSIQGWLLEQGWAMQVFIAPNLRYSDCLSDHEQVARQQDLGIWSLSEYKPGISSTAVPSSVRGAVIVTGRIARIGRSQANIWLNLEGGVAVQIPRSSLENFEQNLEQLQGLQVRVRGWIVKENSQHHQWRIRLVDGRALEVLSG